MKKLFDKIIRFKNIFIKFVLIRKKWISWFENSTFYWFPLINNNKRGVIKVWKNFVWISNEVDNIIWVNHKVIIRTNSDSSIITIWDNVWMSWVSIISNKKIKIWNNVLFWANVHVFDNDFHPINSYNRRNEEVDIKYSKEVVIEDNVFIGMNSIILKGSHIWKNSVIWANSVVSWKVECNSIYWWNPARFIKKIIF